MNAKAVLKKERSYKEDKERAFKNVLQSLQYSLKSEQFLILTGKSLKTMAKDYLKVPWTGGTSNLGATLERRCLKGFTTWIFM